MLLNLFSINSLGTNDGKICSLHTYIEKLDIIKTVKIINGKMSYVGLTSVLLNLTKQGMIGLIDENAPRLNLSTAAPLVVVASANIQRGL